MPDLMHIDGAFMPPSEGRVSAEDRGFNFADGIYEVIRVYGGQTFAMREHLERLERSASGLDLELPHSVEQFEDLCREMIDRSGLREALIYMQVTRGAAPRGHICAEDLRPTVMMFIREARPQPRAWREEGAMALPQPDIRWSLCHLKTIALLPNVLAKNRAWRAGGVEALFHERDGTVTEGSATNAYALRGGEIWTAPVGPKVLPGITRGVILGLAEEMGLRPHEEALTLAEFEGADEVIMSATNLEILPVVRLGEKTIGAGRPGPMYRRIHESYRERVKQACGLGELVPISR
jgi:D-alanine transaminase